MDAADAVIVGAGPIGLEAHAALRAAGASVRHIEAGAIGHTMTWWAPRTTFFSSPDRIAICGIPLSVEGQAKATGDDYVRYLVNVARQLDLNVETFRAATGIRTTDDHFEVEVARSAAGVGGSERMPRMSEANPVDLVLARNVILTTGNMHAPRRLTIEGEDLPHVSHYLDDPLKYFGMIQTF